MNNLEILKIPKYGLTILGRSRGSQHTGFKIPELKLLLDSETIHTFDPEFIFITHNHTDHCFSLPMKLTNIKTKPIILVPKETLNLVVNFVNATFQMEYCDSSFNTNHKFIGVVHDDIIQLKNNMSVKIFDLDHSVPCRGYGLNYSRSKLKHEFLYFDKNQIISLKKKGIEIMETNIEHVLAYLTDTTPIIFSKYSELLQYQYIMIECTFLIQNEKEIELSKKSKHTHWTELYPIIKANPNITFILIHFSNRYTNDELLNFKENINEKNIIFAI